MNHYDFTFIDLFAGIGGIRLGFETIGGKCVFSSEWDPIAQETYKKTRRVIENILSQSGLNVKRKVKRLSKKRK